MTPEGPSVLDRLKTLESKVDQLITLILRQEAQSRGLCGGTATLRLRMSSEAEVTTTTLRCLRSAHKGPCTVDGWSFEPGTNIGLAP